MRIKSVFQSIKLHSFSFQLHIIQVHLQENLYFVAKYQGLLNADEKCFSINQISFIFMSVLYHIQVHLLENLYGTVLRSIEGSCMRA